MNFRMFNTAIDRLMLAYGIDEDTAISIVSDIVDIFELTPQETVEDIGKMIGKLARGEKIV